MNVNAVAICVVWGLINAKEAQREACGGGRSDVKYSNGDAVGVTGSMPDGASVIACCQEAGVVFACCLLLLFAAVLRSVLHYTPLNCTVLLWFAATPWRLSPVVPCPESESEL